MYKIVLIVPYKDMIPEARAAFEEHTGMEEASGTVSPHQYDFAVQYRGDQACQPLDGLEGADAVIARGVAYSLIRELLGDRAVEMRLSVYDLIVIFDRLRKTHGGKKVGVIGSDNMVKHAEEVGAILSMNVKSYKLDTMVTQESADILIADGCEVIVGSILACRFARERGIYGELIRTGKQSILQSIAEAKQIARVVREEQEKAVYMRTVLDYSSEGILSVDSTGMVKSLNRAAKNILGVTDAVVGMPLESLSFSAPLLGWMMDEKTYLNEVVAYSRNRLSLNKVPLINNGENNGNIVTFQDITRLQELEGIIRQKLFTSGHVAKYSFGSILHCSTEMKGRIALAQKYASVDLSVMITGESGTGKEVFAQSIHEYSSRRSYPFVAVNCAALPESLLESELFGYVGGAFTGAAKNGKAGLFEIAHGGTIFLDEISELPRKLQGRLLRVLQEGEIMRLGHDRITSINVRVIAASNKNLKAEVQKGEFREDLYFRLNVLRLTIPPLRERIEDLPLLMEHFFAAAAQKQGVAIITPGDGLLEEMQRYAWPGNVRELMNICERLILVAADGVARLDDLRTVMHDDLEAAETTADSPYSNADRIPVRTMRSQVGQLERQRILEAMELFGRNKARAAEYLGWSRTTLWRKLKLLEAGEPGNTHD